METMMRGTDIPFDIKNFPEGASIARLDFAQQGEVVITKTADDFTYQDGTAYSTISQVEMLKIDPKHLIDIQLSLYINGHAKRTSVVSAKPGRILYEGVV